MVACDHFSTDFYHLCPQVVRAPTPAFAEEQSQQYSKPPGRPCLDDLFGTVCFVIVPRSFPDQPELLTLVAGLTRMFKIIFNDQRQLRASRKKVCEADSCFQSAADLGKEVVFDLTDGLNKAALQEYFRSVPKSQSKPLFIIPAFEQSWCKHG